MERPLASLPPAHVVQVHMARVLKVLVVASVSDRGQKAVHSCFARMVAAGLLNEDIHGQAVLAAGSRQQGTEAVAVVIGVAVCHSEDRRVGNFGEEA